MGAGEGVDQVHYFLATNYIWFAFICLVIFIFSVRGKNKYGIELHIYFKVNLLLKFPYNILDLKPINQFMHSKRFPRTQTKR